MKLVGRVESLWRYPVKSMRGEKLPQLFAGFGGVYGDRWYAFHSSGAIKGAPYLTATAKGTMLLYRAMYRHTDCMLQPSNLAESQALPLGVTPLYPDGADMMVDVRTPGGEMLPVDDPRLIDSLRQGLSDKHDLTLRRSHRSMTDCRPISLFWLQTGRQISREAGCDLDPRRFRANVYLDLEGQQGFAENELVGKTLAIGAQAVIAVVDRDPRCKMITIDPETGDLSPEVMRVLAREHQGNAGLYGAMLIEGTIRPGDAVTLLE